MVTIKVEDVWKSFKIYHDKGSTLKEKILFKRRNHYEERTVLKGINLTINKGEVVGLIGVNGSGKSTLLKMLTKIMYPNKGAIEINGKVSSLLELGAGFHPDMSGRENIYTNASIFGLTKVEINQRIDKIIRFSELEEFIDNPVRTYSSGMYMRLAFSVAINVDADILLIDEILAVGDASFQAKCMNKMLELKAKGTTIVIVSHDMSAIERLCTKAIWLEGGHIRAIGDPYDLRGQYLEFVMGGKGNTLGKPSNQEEAPAETASLVANDSEVNKKRWGSKEIEITEINMINSESKKTNKFKTGEAIRLDIYIQKKKAINEFVMGIGIFRNDGTSCYGTNTQIDNFKIKHYEDEGVISCYIEELNLLPGDYVIDIATHGYDGFPYDYIRSATEFSMHSKVSDVGICRLRHTWKINKMS